MTCHCCPEAKDQTTITPGYAWAVVGLLWAAFFINYVDRGVVFPMFPALREELGFTNTQLGLIGSLFLWSYAFCQPLVGRLADVVSRPRIVVISLILFSLSTLATGLSRSVGMFLSARIMVGITEGLYAPAAYGLIAALHSPATRSRALALHGTAQLTGVVVGSWYGGWMADRYGWRWGLEILAVVGVLYAPCLWVYLRKLPQVQAPPGGTSAAPADVFRSRCYWALLLVFFCFCLILWMIYGWLPSFIYEKYRLSMAESGLTATLYLQASSGAGMLLGGVLADRMVRRAGAARLYIVGTGAVLASPFAYLTLAADSLNLLKLSSAAFGLLGGFMLANFFASCYDLIAERNYGFGGGFLNMIGGWAGGAGMLLAGRWKETIGIEALMGIAVVTAIIAGTVLLAVAAKSFGSDRQRAGLIQAAP